MTAALARVGLQTRSFLALVGEMTILHGRLLARLRGLSGANLRILAKIATNQTRFTGYDAVPLIAGLATVIGAVSIIQAFTLLTGLADDYIGSLIVSVILREMGPVVTAVVLIGRSGTAIATEIGTMRLNGEIDALEAYRIDPVSFIVLPRVAAAVVSMFGLIVLFDVMGIVGGFTVTLLLMDLPFPILLARVMEALTTTDLVVTALKALFFGQVIAALSCYFGLAVKHSPTELPQAVTKAVVTSLASVFLIDGALAAVFYL